MEFRRYSLKDDRRSAPGRKGVLYVIWQLMRAMWRTVTIARQVVFNLLFILLIAMLAGLFFRWGEPTVPENAALVFAPKGRIVEQFSEPLLASPLRGDAEPSEILLRDIIDGIDFAGQDADIQTLLLDLGGLQPAAISQLQEISAALLQFKARGKMIIAAGDYFNQAQYYLAAHADRVYLHPMGRVWIDGYGVYRRYFKNALDRLKVKLHVFRVGTYKSALEPFIRNDMSEAAKTANSAWLEALWTAYKIDVAEQRNLTPAQIDDYVTGYARHLADHDGNSAKAALALGLVDALKTRDQVRQEMIQLVGRDSTSNTFRHIRFSDYLELVYPELRPAGRAPAQVGIIIAQGMIMGGEHGAGRIGADTLTELIRRSRENKRIKALVVRVNSGGGSAQASEIIRREIELTRQAGIPVVVSMGAVAASGGYWMSVSADEIWASPTTLTGSIGIFSAFPTLDEGLASLGVYSDGVGSTPLADAFDPTRPLNPILAESMQQSIENGYRQFIRVVSQGRRMLPEEIENIAQGRVWDGKSALELGLVDGLGGLAEAVSAAARLADVPQHDVVFVKPPLTPGQRLLRTLQRFVDADAVFGSRQNGMLHQIQRALAAELAPIQGFNDPMGVYAFCPVCRIEPPAVR